MRFTSSVLSAFLLCFAASVANGRAAFGPGEALLRRGSSPAVNELLLRRAPSSETKAQAAARLKSVKAKAAKAARAKTAAQAKAAKAQAAIAAAQAKISAQKTKAASAKAAAKAAAAKAAAASQAANSKAASTQGNKCATDTQCLTPRGYTLPPSHGQGRCGSNHHCQAGCEDGYALENGQCVANTPTCAGDYCGLPVGGIFTCPEATQLCTLLCNNGRGYTLNGQGTACLNYLVDPENCGSEGNACPSDYAGLGAPVCRNGNCSLACPGGRHAGTNASGLSICTY